MSGDLHCHSTKSDGSLEPCRLVDLAARLKLPYIALTDHDTMDGVEKAAARGREVGVRVIPGIEITTFDYKNGRKAHILCYMPQKPGPLLELCRETLKNRTEATLKMAEKVAARYPVDAGIVRAYGSKSAALYKQHIMLALMDMGYSLSVFGELYSELFSPKNGWAFVDFKMPETREALRVAKETGGVVVLAHPGVYGNFEIIGELAEMGLAGVEVWHPRQSEEDTRRAFEAARRYKLIRTGGSDFHGMCASKVSVLGARLTEPSELERLFSHIDHAE